MSVYISQIVRHDFYEVHDKDKSLAYAKNTIERLKKNLLIEADEEQFLLQQREGDGAIETIFKLPLYDAEFNLHNGFWRIELPYKYFQMFTPIKGWLWLREIAYDITRALGKDEAWYACEFYTWNGDGCSSPLTTFEQWIDYLNTKFENGIPEFDSNHFLALNQNPASDYKLAYHDSFLDCKIKFQEAQNKLEGYRLLALYPIEKGLFRCEKDNRLVQVEGNTDL